MNYKLDNKKIFFVVALVLLLSTISFAQTSPPPSTGIIDTISKFVNDIPGFTRGGAQANAAASTIYDIVDPGSCGTSWVSTVPGVPKEYLTIFGAEWTNYVIMSVLIVLFVAILIYMFSQLFQSQNLVAVSKDLMFELGRTVLALLFIVMFMQASQTWYGFKTFTTTDPVLQQNTMIDASMAFSRQMIAEISSAYGFLLIYNTIIHTLFSATMWFGITWRAMFSFNLGPILKPIVDMLGFTMQLLSVGLGEWIIHLVMLCMIKKWTWTFFIPLGVVLRAIPPLRGAGDAILALFFSFAIMYPFMFLVTHEAHTILQYSLGVDVTSQKSIMTDFVTNSGLLGVGLTVVSISFLAAGVFVPFFIGAGLTTAFELIRSAIYYIVIISILLPFINIFTTLTFAREVASWLSVDVNFMSFARWI
ncbi:MAG: hypothetical protein Q7S22_05670 [Candidatus Micrarchaeota archaeon]|nr:hypothetical protein [Candidatus Micrarchaeota archaeon]